MIKFIIFALFINSINANSFTENKPSLRCNNLSVRPGGIIDEPSERGFVFMQLLIDFEIWKDIIGFEGYYQISNYGRIKTLERTIFSGSTKMTAMKIEEAVMRSVLNKTTGYLQTCLRKNGQLSKNTVHRLVGIYFVENPFNKPLINHLDGDKQNNYWRNLEWATYSENSIHSYALGLSKSGNSHYNTVVPIEDVHKIMLRRRNGESAISIANEYGVGDKQIYAICAGKRSNH